MHLGLKRLERDSFAVDTDVAITLLFRNDSVAEDFAVPDERQLEEFAWGVDCEHHVDGGEAGRVTVDADEVHEAVVWEGSGEKVGVCGHECHLLYSQYL